MPELLCLQVTERPQDSPLQLSRPASAARTAILLFLARYFSRQAYQGAVTVLLKVIFVL